MFCSLNLGYQSRLVKVGFRLLRECLQGCGKQLISFANYSYPNDYLGSYLGIDVAIKEVLPSTEYDVAKYFEREWRLLKSVPLPQRLRQI